jgi:hypothetical protein
MGIQAKRATTLVGLACLMMTSFSAATDVYEDGAERFPDVRLKVKATQENQRTTAPDPFLGLLNSITLLQSGASPKGETSRPNTGVGIFNKSNWDEATYE